MTSETGKWIIFIGLAIVAVGFLAHFFNDKLHWIGRLPGDIRIERENYSFYFPITTMLIASVILTLIVRIVIKYFR
jgi:hypothetical protein